VRASLASVEAFVKTHQRLARQTASSTAHRPGLPSNHSVTLAYPHIARDYAGIARTHFTPARHIEVTFVALPHGWTGVRADAQVTWIYPRTHSRLGTPDVSIIVRAGSTSRSITNHRALAQITSRINRLQVVPLGRPYSCPARQPDRW
jgi:hypothetical protein